jgi:hypothetical protein
MGRDKGRGTRPQSKGITLPEKAFKESPEYPTLSLRHVRTGFSVKDLTQEQRSEFLLKWEKRSAFSWSELATHPKHGLGFEQLPKKQIKKVAPEHLAQEKYMVLRHEGNHPIVGFKVGEVFYALWVEANYGDVYDH